MAGIGAPVGNRYAAKKRVWTEAIQRALEKRSLAAQKEALEEIAEKLIEKCEEGDIVALKELGDRLEGKATQPVSGPDGDSPVAFNVVLPWAVPPPTS